MYVYKVEIEPTERQKILIHQNMGVCRFIYNAYIYHNQTIYESEKRFVSANEFDKYVNSTLKKSSTGFKPVIRKRGNKPSKTRRMLF